MPRMPGCSEWYKWKFLWCRSTVLENKERDNRGKIAMLVEKNIRDLNVNPYTLFAKKVGCVSTGNQLDGYNAITIAWGKFQVKE